MNGQRTEARVLEFIREHHMVDGSDGVLAAVSGGADSVCLLFILKRLQRELGVRLYAFHLNHGIRGDEADRDEAFTKELCRRLQIPCMTAREDVPAFAAAHKMSEEEAGRLLRYRHLKKEAKRLSCSRTAVAHHMDDDVETVLMNLFRGGGLKGIGGIRPVRGEIIRPLLCLRRQEIEAYLKEQGQEWCEDSTNRDGVYGRNRLRNVLLPWIREQVNSRAEEHILNFSRLAAQADEYFEEQAEILLSEEWSRGTVKNSVRTEVFDAQPEIVKTYLARRLIFSEAVEQRDISSRHLEAVLALGGPAKGTSVDLPYGLRAVRDYELLSIERKPGLKGVRTERVRPEKHPPEGIKPEKQPPEGTEPEKHPPEGTEPEKHPPEGTEPEKQPLEGIQPDWAQLGEPRPEDSRAFCVQAYPESPEAASGHGLVFRRFPIEKGADFPKNQYTKWFDYDKIKDTLFIRHRREGDYFRISEGKKKSLRRFLIDEKVRAEDRDKILVLAEGNHILWVVGYRISEYYKITDATRNILEVKMCKGEENG